VITPYKFLLALSESGGIPSGDTTGVNGKSEGMTAD
jgi:hypothetical protein